MAKPDSMREGAHRTQLADGRTRVFPCARHVQQHLGRGSPSGLQSQRGPWGAELWRGVLEDGGNLAVF